MYVQRLIMAKGNLNFIKTPLKKQKISSGVVFNHFDDLVDLA